MDIARDYYSKFEDRALSKTKKIEIFIKDKKTISKSKRGKNLHTFVKNKTSEYNLAGNNYL
ncbi:MAG: hypothetical protein CM1200mP16_04800 [Nitrospina sp.]|nr:MAG: hypothetical protein CM1200mP16_04800 [Nitrospina sp.]